MEGFERILNDERMQAYFRVLDLNITDAKDLFRILDADKDGTIDIEEFTTGCQKLRGGAKNIDVATLMQENRRVIRAVTHLMKKMKEEHSEHIAALSRNISQNYEENMAAMSHTISQSLLGRDKPSDVAAPHVPEIDLSNHVYKHIADPSISRC